jgi:hypothetical protein
MQKSINYKLKCNGECEREFKRGARGVLLREAEGSGFALAGHSHHGHPACHHPRRDPGAYTCPLPNVSVVCRGSAAKNAPSPPLATLSTDPLKALYTTPDPRAGLSERDPPSHLSGKSWPAQPYTRVHFSA